MDFGTGSFPIVLNFVWSLLFSLFYHEKGAMNKDRGLLLQEAIRQAVIYCRENDIMQPFLTDNSSEVENMLLTDWNWDEAMEVAKEEAWKDGQEQGWKEGKKEEAFDIAKKLLAMGLDLDMIIKGTGLTAEQIQSL